MEALLTTQVLSALVIVVTGIVRVPVRGRRVRRARRRSAASHQKQGR